MSTLWILLPSFALAADAPKDAGDDRERLQGTWKVVSMVNDGKEVPADKIRSARLTFEGDRFSMKGADEDFRGRFRLIPGKTPRQIDTVFVDADNKELGAARGVYELDGKRLRVSWKHEGDRPTELASKPGSGARLMVLEKVEKE